MALQSPAKPTDIAKSSIELFKPGGEGAGIEEILDRGGGGAGSTRWCT